MKTLTSNISIGSYRFTGIVDVRVKHSYETLTDTCVLKLPRKVKWENKNIYLGESGLLKSGDPVIVNLGYDSQNKQVFKGYLNSVSLGIPVKIEAEDSMSLLKLNATTKSYKSVNLKQLISDIVPSGIDYQTADVALGQFRISNSTPAQILHTLKKEYGLYSFFRNEKLYVGLAVWPEYQKTHTFEFGRNIISKPGEGMQYKKSEDTKIKVKAISIFPDNSREEITVGDKEGQQITMYQYNVSKSDLQTFAMNELLKHKYTGFRRNSIVVFGEPHAKHGDIAKIEGSANKEKNGSYVIKEINYIAGKRGYKQKITLDIKV